MELSGHGRSDAIFPPLHGAPLMFWVKLARGIRLATVSFMAIVLLVWFGIGVVFCLALLLAAARPKPSLNDGPELLHQVPAPKSLEVRTPVTERLPEPEPVAFSVVCHTR